MMNAWCMASSYSVLLSVIIIGASLILIEHAIKIDVWPTHALIADCGDANGGEEERNEKYRRTTYGDNGEKTLEVIESSTSRFFSHLIKHICVVGFYSSRVYRKFSSQFSGRSHLKQIHTNNGW